MSVLPWSQLIPVASQLGLMPSAFWALSVFEWRALMGEGQGLDAARLSEMCAAFPDDYE
jgi:Phage tail assembly chaperone protein, TAC